jgi:hypothetical protein
MTPCRWKTKCVVCFKTAKWDGLIVDDAYRDARDAGWWWRAQSRDDIHWSSEEFCPDCAKAKKP